VSIGAFSWTIPKLFHLATVPCAPCRTLHADKECDTTVVLHQCISLKVLSKSRGAQLVPFQLLPLLKTINNEHSLSFT